MKKSYVRSSVFRSFRLGNAIVERLSKCRKKSHADRKSGTPEGGLLRRANDYEENEERQGEQESPLANDHSDFTRSQTHGRGTCQRSKRSRDRLSVYYFISTIPPVKNYLSLIVSSFHDDPPVIWLLLVNTKAFLKSREHIMSKDMT